MVISNPEKRGFRINAFQRSCIQCDIQFFTLIRGRKYYCIRSPCTKTVHGRFFLRLSPYVPAYDTEIYDLNTIPCKPSYFSVYGRLRPCLFDLDGDDSLRKNILLLFFIKSIYL
jgi:hypothetical protein